MDLSYALEFARKEACLDNTPSIDEAISIMEKAIKGCWFV